MLIARGQYAYQAPPTFFAPVFAHHGEFSNDAFRLVERLSGAVRARAVADSARFDGLGPNAVSADFRNRLKDALCAVVVGGVGRLLACTGAPL